MSKEINFEEGGKSSGNKIKIGVLKNEEIIMKNEGLNVLSLFDGMSCGQIALNRIGVKVSKYYASEIDKSAIEIAKKNYPNTIHLGDIAKIKGDALDRIDLVIGGSPCQSFSRGGDGSGFNGKSGLFYEYMRVLKEVKPKYFLLENVVMKKEWENIITEYLGVKPILIDSKLVSAQKRQRLYWTNIPNVEQPVDEKIELCNIVTDGKHEIINSHEVVLGKEGSNFIIRNGTKKGYLIAEDGDGVNLEFPKSTSRRGRVSKGKTNTLNTACNYGVVLDGDLVRLNINELEQLQNLPIDYTKGVSDNQRKKMIGNGWTVNVIAHIFKNIK